MHLANLTELGPQVAETADDLARAHGDVLEALTEEALTARRPHCDTHLASAPLSLLSPSRLIRPVATRLRCTVTNLHLCTLSQTYTFLTAVSN